MGIYHMSGIHMFGPYISCLAAYSYLQGYIYSTINMDPFYIWIFSYQVSAGIRLSN
jgi:hypothetical protein